MLVCRLGCFTDGVGGYAVWWGGVGGAILWVFEIGAPGLVVAGVGLLSGDTRGSGFRSSTLGLVWGVLRLG